MLLIRDNSMQADPGQFQVQFVHVCFPRSHAPLEGIFPPPFETKPFPSTHTPTHGRTPPYAPFLPPPPSPQTHTVRHGQAACCLLTALTSCRAIIWERILKKQGVGLTWGDWDLGDWDLGGWETGTNLGRPHPVVFRGVSRVLPETVPVTHNAPLYPGKIDPPEGSRPRRFSARVEEHLPYRKRDFRCPVPVP